MACPRSRHRAPRHGHTRGYVRSGDRPIFFPVFPALLRCRGRQTSCPCSSFTFLDGLNRFRFARASLGSLSGAPGPSRPVRPIACPCPALQVGAPYGDGVLFFFSLSCGMMLSPSHTQTDLPPTPPHGLSLTRKRKENPTILAEKDDEQTPF